MARIPRKPKQKTRRHFRMSLFRSRRSAGRLVQDATSERSAVVTRQHFFDSRLFVVVLIGLVAMLLVSVTREAIRRIQIAHEIRVVQERLVRLEERNAQMTVLTNVLNTSVAQEKQSRLTLNSIAPGEKVIIIQSELEAGGDGAEADQIILPNGETVDTIEQTHSGSNPQKWFDYFFRNL